MRLPTIRFSNPAVKDFRNFRLNSTMASAQKVETASESNNQGQSNEESAQTSATQSEQSEQMPDRPLGLPAPGDASRTTLDMSSGSATVKMDHLGPLVVNQDGSLSRIANWEQMTEFEQKNTLRIIGKRNAARREALMGEGPAQA